MISSNALVATSVATGLVGKRALEYAGATSSHDFGLARDSSLVLSRQHHRPNEPAEQTEQSGLTIFAL
jgi:hypothetical protein